MYGKYIQNIHENKIHDILPLKSIVYWNCLLQTDQDVCDEKMWTDVSYAQFFCKIETLGGNF